jgi:hypothetical protein
MGKAAGDIALSPCWGLSPSFSLALNLDIVRKTSGKWNSVVSVWIYPKGCIFYNNIQYVPYF